MSTQISPSMSVSLCCTHHSSVLACDVEVSLFIPIWKCDVKKSLQFCSSLFKADTKISLNILVLTAAALLLWKTFADLQCVCCQQGQMNNWKQDTSEWSFLKSTQCWTRRAWESGEDPTYFGAPAHNPQLLDFIEPRLSSLNSSISKPQFAECSHCVTKKQIIEAQINIGEMVRQSVKCFSYLPWWESWLS